MMNPEHAERLLREYLLSHRPKPFDDLVGVGKDPRNAGCLVFREPGTHHDLVIATKFLPEPGGDSKTHPENRQADHWEHAMYSGMAWRQEINKLKFHRLRERNEKALGRIASPHRQGNPAAQTPLLPPSLIITATFTNRFGLELVGHVDESPMEDVQFRLQARSSVSTALEYTTILGYVPIYRWKTRDRESPWNVIGFANDFGGNLSGNNSVAITASPTRLSLQSLCAIVERNYTAIRPTGCNPTLPKMATPCANGSPSVRSTPIRSNESKFPFSDSTLSFLRGALPLPSSGRKDISPHQKVPFAPSTIATPNSRGPFAPPYRCWRIQWEPGPLDDDIVFDEDKIVEFLFNANGENSKKHNQVFCEAASISNRCDPRNRVQKRQGCIAKVAPESRNDRSTFRSDIDVAKKVPSSSSGDIAINLLCPYHHPPNQAFEISHETHDQQALRHKIEGSPFCKNLMGRFAMNLFAQNAPALGQQTDNGNHYNRTVREFQYCLGY